MYFKKVKNHEFYDYIQIQYYAGGQDSLLLVKFLDDLGGHQSLFIFLFLLALETYHSVFTCPPFTDGTKAEMFYTAYEMFEGHRQRKFPLHVSFIISMNKLAQVMPTQARSTIQSRLISWDNDILELVH